MAYTPLHILAMEHGQAPHDHASRAMASSGVASVMVGGGGVFRMIPTARFMRFRQRLAARGLIFLDARLAVVAQAMALKFDPAGCKAVPPTALLTVELTGGASSLCEQSAVGDRGGLSRAGNGRMVAVGISSGSAQISRRSNRYAGDMVALPRRRIHAPWKAAGQLRHVHPESCARSARHHATACDISLSAPLRKPRCGLDGACDRPASWVSQIDTSAAVKSARCLALRAANRAWARTPTTNSAADGFGMCPVLGGRVGIASGSPVDGDWVARVASIGRTTGGAV